MDNEYEPMDVDLSSNSIQAMDISYKEIEPKTPQIKIKEEPCNDKYIDSKENANCNIQPVPATPIVIKRFSLNRRKRNTSHKSNTSHISNKTLSIIFAILASISILIYQTINITCSKELDLKVLNQSLSKNLFGQRKAIGDIINAMEERSHTKILILYGGTGVGKTLTISLILENFYQYANVYHYTMPSFIDSFSTDFLLGLILCPTSMIIVDDLKRTDIHVKEHISKLIEKSQNLNRNITIILVFNCDMINDEYIKTCDNSFYANLKESFSDLEALKMYIKFNSLTEEHLKRCIEKELGSKRLSPEKYEDFLKHFNVSVDGCKGVHKKVKLLNL